MTSWIEHVVVLLPLRLKYAVTMKVTVEKVFNISGKSMILWQDLHINYKTNTQPLKIDSKLFNDKKL